MCAKYYELRYMLYIKIAPLQSRIVKIRVIFGVRFERRKVDSKRKPTRKLKHANSILESFEYFCQMSSKLIVIILSYTVSKFARFFLRHSVCLYLLSFSSYWSKTSKI